MAELQEPAVRELIYRRVARLLVQARGEYAVELARKRAVASRLMGDEAESRDWARVRQDVELLLDELHRDGHPDLLTLADSREPWPAAR